MRSVTTWKRHPVDTATGEKISITTVYYSFDKSEIDKMEETVRKHLGDGYVTEVSDGSTGDMHNV